MNVDHSILQKSYHSKPSKETLDEIGKIKTHKMYHSIFDFLNDQNCWRLGDIHCLLGMESSGKSTITNSLMMEAGLHIPVLNFLSEETTGDTWHSLGEAYNEMLNSGFVSVTDKDPRDNLHIYSELDEECADLFTSPSEVVMYIKAKCIETKAKLLIFDNITTSAFYRELKDQEKFCIELKTMAKQMGLPVFVVAHTGKQFAGKNFIRSGDVRGNNLLAMIAEHFFCFNHRVVYNEITGIDEHNVILQAVKYRGQKREDLFFDMRFNKATRFYDKSTPISSKIAHSLLSTSKEIAVHNVTREGDSYIVPEKMNLKVNKETAALKKRTQGYLDGML